MDVMTRRRTIINSVMKDNTVIGSFLYTSNDKGTAKTIDLPYHGNGYPVSVIIFPSSGPSDYNASWYNKVQRYANVFYCAIKSIISSSSIPDYVNDDANNYAFVITRYKNSTSSSNVYATAAMAFTPFYKQNVISDSNYYSIVSFDNKNTMKVFVANTSNGFLDGVEYTYIIEYSE